MNPSQIREEVIDGRRLFFVGRDVSRVGISDIDQWITVDSSHHMLFDEVHENLGDIVVNRFVQGVHLQNGYYVEVICNPFFVGDNAWRVTQFYPQICDLVIIRGDGGHQDEEVIWRTRHNVTDEYPARNRELKLFSSPEEAVAFLYAVGVHIPDEVPVSSDYDHN